MSFPSRSYVCRAIASPVNREPKKAAILPGEDRRGPQISAAGREAIAAYMSSTNSTTSALCVHAPGRIHSSAYIDFESCSLIRELPRLFSRSPRDRTLGPDVPRFARHFPLCRCDPLRLPADHPGSRHYRGATNGGEYPRHPVRPLMSRGGSLLSHSYTTNERNR